MMHRLSALGIAIVVMLLGVLVPVAPASADCQGGVVWPSLDRARGTTFIGVFEGATEDERGSTTSHWTVERVLAGPLEPGPLDGWGIGGGCHPTGYRDGTRYLVSSQFAGGADAFDTVAYELLGEGRVRLAPYPEQPRRTAPRVYRQVDTLREALDLLVPERAPRTSAPGSAPSPSFVPSAEGKARDDRLVLTIATDRTQVHEFETIPITTTLRYVGPVKRERATLYGPSGSLVAFRVEQLDGPLDTGPGWGPQCWYYRFGPDEVKDIPFEKSGGYDPDDPMAPFWKLWFADRHLRFAAGRYVITAYAHHGGRNGRCIPPWNTLTTSVAIEVLPRPAMSPDPTAEPFPTASGSPSPGPTATPAVSTVELWSPVDLAALPWPYTCNSPPFRASTISTPGGIPTDDPALQRLVQVRGPDAHLLWADEDDAVVGLVVDGSPRSRNPIYYHDLAKVDGLWRAGGGEGDCQPWARFEQLRALGGRWRPDPAYPPPNRRSTVLHTLVTYPGCPTAVEPRGRPRVAATDEAVVVVVPVVTTNTSDMCTPGKPSAVTIRLPEPLGDRALYDAGTLPMREVRVAR